MAFLLLSWTIALKTLHLASIGMEIIYNEQLLADIMFYMRMLSMTACSTELSLHNLPYNHIKKDNVFESCYICSLISMAPGSAGAGRI